MPIACREVRILLHTPCWRQRSIVDRACFPLGLYENPDTYVIRDPHFIIDLQNLFLRLSACDKKLLRKNISGDLGMIAMAEPTHHKNIFLTDKNELCTNLKQEAQQKTKTSPTVHQILDEFSKRSFYSLDGKDRANIDRFLDEELHALYMTGETDHLDFCTTASAFMARQEQQEQQVVEENITASRDIPTILELNRGCSLMSYVDPSDLLEAVFDPAGFFEQDSSGGNRVDPTIAAAAKREENYFDSSFSGRSVTPTSVIQPDDFLPKNCMMDSTNVFSSPTRTLKHAYDSGPTAADASRKKARIALESQVESNLLACIYPMDTVFTSELVEEAQIYNSGCFTPSPLEAPQEKYESRIQPRASKKVRKLDRQILKNIKILQLEQRVASSKSKSTSSTSTTKKVVKMPACRGAWANMYKECKSFFKKYGHCAIPTKFPENPRLASWAKNIRNLYQRRQRGDTRAGVLAHHQIALLNEVGFCWSHVERKWNLQYEKIRLEIRETGRPQSSEGSRWVRTQKEHWANNKLSPGQGQKLKELGWLKSNSNGK